MRALEIAAVVLTLLVAACGGDAGRLAGEVGNGGHGVVVGNRVVLYDLWEAGIADRGEEGLPQLLDDRDRARFAFFMYQLHETLPETSFPLAHVASKLSRLHRADPVLALSLAEAILLYRWQIVPESLRTLPVPDPVLRHDGVEIVLIANRNGRSIYLSRPTWDRMDELNRVALVFHEAIYSLLQTSGQRVRQITAVIFRDVSGETLERNGLLRHASRAELPLLSAAAPLESFTSTFIAREGRVFRRGLEPDVLAVVGSARLELAVTETDVFALTLPPRDFDDRTAIADACHRLVTLDRTGFEVRLGFAPGAYELRFATAEENGRTKQYLEHRALPRGRPLFLMRELIVTLVERDIRHSLHRAEQTVRRRRGQPPPPPLPPDDPAQLRATCARDLTTRLPHLRDFLFPSQWPFGPGRAPARP